MPVLIFVCQKVFQANLHSQSIVMHPTMNDAAFRMAGHPFTDKSITLIACLIQRAANARTSQPRNPIPLQEATSTSTAPLQADAPSTAAAVAAAKRAEEMERERRERDRLRERMQNAPGPSAVAQPSAPPMPSTFDEVCCCFLGRSLIRGVA